MKASSASERTVGSSTPAAKSKSDSFLACGNLAVVIWYLTDRAFLSAASAASSSRGEAALPPRHRHRGMREWGGGGKKGDGDTESSVMD